MFIIYQLHFYYLKTFKKNNNSMLFKSYCCELCHLSLSLPVQVMSDGSGVGGACRVRVPPQRLRGAAALHRRCH